MATARAAAVKASSTDAMSALRHSGFVKISNTTKARNPSAERPGLLLVDGHTRDHDERRGKKQSDKEHIEASKQCFGHAALSLRPTSSVRPTKARVINTRNTAIAAANGMLDW